MKKNLNIIQINGFKGIALITGAGCCLTAGFVVFPGWVAMNLWNLGFSLCENVPKIGLVQGILLWCILVASYFIFRKERIIIRVRTPEGLSEEELKTVFADLKKQAKDDKVLQAMLKAREIELHKPNDPEESDAEKTEIK